MNAFITGTDTGVGKTYCTALLARSLRATGLDTIALKPVCSGPRDDAEALRSACQNELAIEEVNPLWYPLPVAPAVACGQHPPDLLALADWFDRVTAGRRSVLVEGAGGWLVPLAPSYTMADLAVRFSLPVLVVVPNRLGCINHALLTAESIRARGLSCQGFLLNNATASQDDPSTSSNRRLIEQFSGLPVVAEIAASQTTLRVG